VSDRPHCQYMDDCASKGPGHCKSCAAILRALNPEYRKMMSEAKIRSFQADPEKRKRVGRKSVINFMAWHAKVDWKAFHSDRSARFMAWCPENRIEEYRSLRRRWGPEEAKRLILDEEAYKGRMEVARISREMLEKHRREVSSRY
jgi:hypothetical protein